MQDIMPADAVQVLKRSFLRNMGGTPTSTPTAAVAQAPAPPPPPAPAGCTPFTSAAAPALAAATTTDEPSPSYGDNDLTSHMGLTGSNGAADIPTDASGPDAGPAITIVRNSFPGGAVPDTPPLSTPPHHSTTATNPSTSRLPPGLSIAPPASPNNPPDAGLSPVLPSVPFSPTNPGDGPLRTSSVATTMGPPLSTFASSFTSTVTTFGRGSSFAYSLPSAASLGTIPSFSRNAAKASAASGRSFFLQRPPLGSALQRSPSYGGPARPLVGPGLNPHLDYGSSGGRERSSWPAMSTAHDSTTSSNVYGSHQHGSSCSQLPSTVLMSPPPGPLPPIGQEADGEVESDAEEAWLEAKDVGVAMEAAGAKGAGRKKGVSRMDSESCTVAGSYPTEGGCKSAGTELGEFDDGGDGDGDGDVANVSGELAAAAAGRAAAAGALDSRAILSSILETETLDVDRTDAGAGGGSPGSSGRNAEVSSPASERGGRRPFAGMPPSPDGGGGGRPLMLHRSLTTPAESLTGANSSPLPSQLVMVRSSVSARTSAALGLGSGRALTAGSATGSRTVSSRASGSGAPGRRSCELIAAARAAETSAARPGGGAMDATGSSVHSSSGAGGPVLALRPLPLVQLANQRSSSSGAAAAAAAAAASAFSSGIIGAGPSVSSGSHFLRRSVTDHLTVDDQDLGTPTLRRLMGFRGSSATGTPAAGGGGSIYGSPLAHVRSLHLAPAAAPDSPMSYGTGVTPTSGVPGAAGGGAGGVGGVNSPLQQSGGGTRILAGAQEVPYKQWHRNGEAVHRYTRGWASTAVGDIRQAALTHMGISSC